MKHTRKYFWRLSLLFLVYALLFGSFGCDNAADVSNIDVSSNTGSVTFDIVWEKVNEDAENPSARTISDVCGSTNWDDVFWVRAGIFNGDTAVVDPKEWLCSDGSGSFTGVTPGTGYSLFVVGLNSDDNTVYSGKASINVIAGQTTNAGTIVTIKSFATKKSPPFNGAMGIDPYNHTFEWDEALSITKYNFEIQDRPWGDPSAVKLVDVDVMEGTSYTISAADGLNPDTTYYWGVFPVSFDDRTGYDYTWSFTTGTAVTEDNYEPNDMLASAWNNAGDPSDWENKWLSQIDGNGLAAGNADWYQIEVNTPGYERIMIECRFAHDNGDVDLQLYNDSGVLLVSADSKTDNEYIDYIVPSTGIYYIMIETLDLTNTYDLFWADVEINGAAGIWTLNYDWGCDGSDGTATTVLYPGPNNFFVTPCCGGSWMLSGDLFSMIYGNGTTYTTNNIVNYPITGTMTSFQGNTGCWTAYLYENP